MHIVVRQCDWGDVLHSNIETLLSDVASHIARLLRESVDETIVVATTPSTNDGPITLYRLSPQCPYQILLQTRDRKWAQYAYQFSHEFCHVLSNYEALQGSLNGWFHEALCELASLFTLRQMSKAWRTHPPYPNWNEYASSLASYATNCLERPECQLPTGVALANWLTAEEESFRQDRYQRNKNSVVAYSLLPIFESEPTGWNTIRSLPRSSTRFLDYLLEWSLQVDAADRPFVERIMQIFSDPMENA